MVSKSYGVVYIIENTITGAAYIGQTVNVINRWSQHRSLLQQARHTNRYMQRSWKKHGAACFEFAIIDTADSADMLNELERFHIEYLRYCGAVLYNCREGGDSSKRIIPRPPINAETRQRRSETLKRKGIRPSPEAAEAARQVSIGRKKTPKERAKWRAANIERMQSEPYRQAMSDLKRGVKLGTYKVTDKMQAKWEAQKGLIEDPEQTARRIAAMVENQPLRRFRSPDGLIYETRNVTGFARQHGLHERLIHHLVSGKQKHHRGWTLVEQEDSS